MHISLAVEQEFRKVPLNVFRDDFVFAFLEKLVGRSGIVAVDINFRKDRIGDAVVLIVPFLDRVAFQRLLFSELIARKCEYLEVPVFVLFVYFLQLTELGCQPSVAGRIDDQYHFAVQGFQCFGLPVRAQRFDRINFVHLYHLER